jgi:hypothetical protein
MSRNLITGSFLSAGNSLMHCPGEVALDVKRISLKINHVKISPAEAGLIYSHHMHRGSQFCDTLCSHTDGNELSFF